MDSADDAVARAVDEDLRSPDSADDGVEDESERRAHSFRERRLTYTRHHVVSDSAAAAVAQLLAEGEDFSDDDDDDDDDDEEGADVAEKGDEAPGDEAASEAGGADDDDGAPAEPSAAAAAGGKRPRSDDSKSCDGRPRKRIHLRAKPKQPAETPSPAKNYLPSRVLHAGEIVRRLSHNSRTGKGSHDARTGAHSHPTHPGNHNGQHGHGHRNKWRQRFSFCSSAPDHVLPFPRNVVGTYSCHGMEPVYDSEYSDSADEENYDDENAKAKTTAKINQDRGGIAYPYANSARQALFAVYDGHGDGGELVSQYALGEVQRLLEGSLRSLPPPETEGGGLGGIAEEESDEEGEREEGEESQRRKDEEEEEEEEELISRAMREVFVTVDRGLLDEEEIEPMYSGTTACAVLLRNDKLYISNCGDSRAVLARRRGDPKGTGGNDDDEPTTADDLATVPLSVDQNPDSPGEKERILSAGGYVSPPPEPGLSSRVWLDAANTQIGLAMARSLGDHAVKGVGVIAEPVITTHDLEDDDDFLIIATDGVWEFISSEDAVEIVGRHLYGEGEGGASAACEALIKAASEKWHEHEGDYRDDITAIVIRLKDLWT